MAETHLSPLELDLHQHQLRCDEERLRQEEILKEAMRHAMESAIRYHKDEAERAELRQKMEAAHAEQRDALLRLQQQRRDEIERLHLLPPFEKVLKSESDRNAQEEEKLRGEQQKELSDEIKKADSLGLKELEKEELRKSLEEQHKERLKELAYEQQQRMDRITLLHKGPPERYR